MTDTYFFTLGEIKEKLIPAGFEFKIQTDETKY